MTTYDGTEVIRIRHILVASILAELLVWIGVIVSQTFVGMIIRNPDGDCQSRHHHHSAPSLGRVSRVGATRLSLASGSRFG